MKQNQNLSRHAGVCDLNRGTVDPPKTQVNCHLPWIAASLVPNLSKVLEMGCPGGPGALDSHGPDAFHVYIYIYAKTQHRPFVKESNLLVPGTLVLDSMDICKNLICLLHGMCHSIFLESRGLLNQLFSASSLGAQNARPPKRACWAPGESGGEFSAEPVVSVSYARSTLFSQFAPFTLRSGDPCRGLCRREGWMSERRWGKSGQSVKGTLEWGARWLSPFVEAAQGVWNRQARYGR